MQYIGKLYGKIGKKYFETGKTSEDWDALEKATLEPKNWEPKQDSKLMEHARENTQLKKEIVKLRKLLYQVEVKIEQDNMNDAYDGIWRDNDEDILAQVKAESLDE